MNKILLGCHVGMNAPDFYLGSVKEALSYGANTFMFYTGAPQNSYRKDVKDLKIEEGRKVLLEAGIDESKLVVHAPYIINAANKTKPDLFELSINLIVNELRRTEAFHAQILVLHPGAHVGQGKEVAIANLCEALDRVFAEDGTKVKIAIETMAGKGTEIGTTFEEVKAILSGCHYPDRLGVCLDTCHISDGGYFVHDADAILDEFDRVIGLENLLVVHLNDSKNPMGAHKDRHENVGYGEIGFKTLYSFASNPRLTNIPKILETPYVNEKAPYKEEISMLQNGQYIENWKDQF